MVAEFNTGMHNSSGGRRGGSASRSSSSMRSSSRGRVSSSSSSRSRASSSKGRVSSSNGRVSSSNSHVSSSKRPVISSSNSKTLESTGSSSKGPGSSNSVSRPIRPGSSSSSNGGLENNSKPSNKGSPSYPDPPPPYSSPRSFSPAGTQTTQPYNQRGLLGQVYSLRNTNLPNSAKNLPNNQYKTIYRQSNSVFRTQYGIPKPMHPMMPSTNIIPLHSHTYHPYYPRSNFLFIPMPIYTRSYYPDPHYRNFSDSNYKGECGMPLNSGNSVINCTSTSEHVLCKLSCENSYRFKDNTTSTVTHKCWHVLGVWSPTKNFPKCIPTCQDKCLNGGKCIQPGVCICSAGYKGAKCEEPILNCDIHQLAIKQIREVYWKCRQTENETVCHIKCQYGKKFANGSQSQEFRCITNKGWIPNKLSNCILDANVTTTSTNTSTNNSSAPVSNNTIATETALASNNATATETTNVDSASSNMTDITTNPTSTAESSNNATTLPTKSESNITTSSTVTPTDVITYTYGTTTTTVESK